MGKSLIIPGADFSTVAVQIEKLAANNFSWGNGGIISAGVSSGSTNRGMSMIGEMEQATEELTLVASNGYVIEATVISPTKFEVGTIDMGRYTQYTYPEDCLAKIIIPKGYYYQIHIATLDGSNANINEGGISLLKLVV